MMRTASAVRLAHANGTEFIWRVPAILQTNDGLIRVVGTPIAKTTGNETWDVRGFAGAEVVESA